MNLLLQKKIWVCNLIILLALLASCNPYEKVRKSSDVNYKLTKANEYYDNKSYYHANELYKELMPIMKSTRNYESLCFKYSYSFYYLKDYIQASYHFKNFAEAFPTSKYAEECEFMSSVCLFKYAPKGTLDQSNTNKALEALQTYIVKYPNSTHSKEANDYIDQSRKKLEAKDADAAHLYFNISQYKAATVAYKSLMRNYPESGSTDYYYYMIMRSWFKYASQSIIEKQEERFANASGAYNELKVSFPNSSYMEVATNLHNEIDKNLKKIRNELHK